MPSFRDSKFHARGDHQTDMTTGSAAGMESLEKVWNLFFQFPDLEKVWKFVKSFGNFKKRFGTFCLLPEKILKTESPAARALGSCCHAFDGKQFEG